MTSVFFRELCSDLRLAFRRFRQAPITGTATIILLSIGIGGHAGVISFVQAVTTRPPAGVAPGVPAVRLRGTELIAGPGKALFPRALTQAEVEAFQFHPETFAEVAPWFVTRLNVRLPDTMTTRLVTAHFTTAALFPILRLQPLLGRALLPGDDAPEAEPVAVLSEPLWREGFGADSTVIGSLIQINAYSVRIVGVAPQGFVGPLGDQGDDPLWLPISSRAKLLDSGAASPEFEAIALPARGVQVTVASQLVGSLSTRLLAATSPQPGVSARSADVVLLRGSTTLPASASPDGFYIKYGAFLATLILALVCVNLSALQVGAARARRQEVAVRSSLGAPRRRLVRQFLTESIALAIAGGVVGLIGWSGLSAFFATQVHGLKVAPDLVTLAATTGVAMFTGVAFGLAPALYATRATPASLLKDSGSSTPRRSRLQESIVVAQVVISVPILIAISILAREGILREPSSPLAADVLEHTIQLRMNWGAVSTDWRQVAAKLEKATARLATLPSVTGVVPVAMTRGELTGRGRGEAMGLRWHAATPGFYTLQGLPPLAGREPRWTDTTGTLEPVLISGPAARRLVGPGEVVGRTFLLDRPIARGRDSAIIVGVLPDRALRISGELVQMSVLERGRTSWGEYLIRTTGSTSQLIPVIESSIRAVSPQIGVSLQTLAQRQSTARASAFWTGNFAAALAALALTLTVTGLYALTAIAVADRRREIGIRVAIGAPNRSVVRLFVGQSLRLAVRGMLIGVMIALLVAAVTVSSGRVWWAVITASALVCAGTTVVMAIGCLLPAVRAVTTDPMRALR